MRIIARFSGTVRGFRDWLSEQKKYQKEEREMNESRVSCSAGAGSTMEQLEYGAGQLIEALRIFNANAGMIGLLNSSIQCKHQDFFRVFDRSKITFRDRGTVEYQWEAMASVNGACFLTLINKTIVLWLLKSKFYSADELRGLLPMRVTLDEMLAEEGG